MKTISVQQGPEAVAKLRALAREISVAMVTTVTPEGALRSRPMVTLDVDDDGELWFFTSDNSGKAHDIAEEHAVNVSYAEPGQQRYVSVTGNASIVHDPAQAREMWRPELKTFFPGGLEQPHLALLRVRIETGEYWDSPSGQGKPFFGARGMANGYEPAHGEHGRLDIRATPASG